jgi:hypothetical protein
VHAPSKRSFLARLLTVKALVAGGVAVSTGVVLAAVGGALPGPGLEPGNTPPSVTSPAPTTTEQQQDGPASTTDEPAGRPTSPPTSTQERCGDCRSGDDGRDNPGADGPGDDNPGNRRLRAADRMEWVRDATPPGTSRTHSP